MTNVTSGKIFLTARWENLLLCTYDVSPEFLLPYLPKGVEPDTIDGRAFLSIVAFDFLETKVKGIKIPFHVNFPEINLRLYVKSKDRRGVVFIKELVPRSMIALFARVIYNENYRGTPMYSEITKGEVIKLQHGIIYKGSEYSINMTAENKPYMPANDSAAHFFKEHEWGFGSTKKGKPLVYRVEHPEWQVCNVTDFKTDFDFGVIYGSEWNFLNSQKPYNITFALGSEVKVFEAEEL